MSREHGLTLRRLLGVLSMLALITLAVAVLGLAFGSSGAGGSAFLLRLASGGLDAFEQTILLQARLPRVAFALVVGAALAVAGAVFQAILRNPLADPYILGVSGGAALGGTLALALGAGTAIGAFGVTGGAFVGAAAAILLILMVGGWAPAGQTGTYVLLLTGVIFNAFASAAIMFLKSIVSAQKAQELLFYLMGTLSVEGTPLHEVGAVAAVVLLALGGLLWFARDLNVLSLGDEEAASLGVDVAATRRWTVILASVAVAVAVAYSGLIGFVGLVVPHAVRLAFGPDHRLLLPACALVGAAFLVAADLLARASFGAFDTALPVGVVTAFVGAPVFFLFLRRTLRGS